VSSQSVRRLVRERLSSDQPVVYTRGLARTFFIRKTTVQAVRGIDLSVDPGEIVGFLGPNGAGKTTILRMLTTLLAPTAGDATVAGCDLRADPGGVRRRIGYVPQAGGADPRCRVGEELVQQGRFYRLSPAAAARRAGELCSLLDLTGLEHRTVSTLSGGQRRRLDIALGLVHIPRLVFLDEPSAGLDPQARSNVWELLRQLRGSFGTTVILTTHYMEEADSLCDRVFVIDLGRIVAAGPPAELKRRISGDLVTIEVTGDPERARLAVADGADRVGIQDLVVAGQTLRLTVERGDHALVTLTRSLGAAGVEFATVQLHRPTLDDVFLDLTGHSLRNSQNGAGNSDAGTAARHRRAQPRRQHADAP
jgi:ABC-2 type transport system ATP-binding protein